jgi:hypothetical protein
MSCSDASSLQCPTSCTLFPPCSKHANLPTATSIDLQTAIDAKVGAPEPKGFVNKWYNKAKDAALYGTSVDIHEIVEEDPFINALHARAEKFDEHAEHAFGYLQVTSALAQHTMHNQPAHPFHHTVMEHGMVRMLQQEGAW